MEVRSLLRRRLKPSLRMQFDACTKCGLCVKWCPAVEELGDTVVSPAKKIQLLRKASKKKNLTESEIEELKRVFYACSECGACAAVCGSLIDTPELWEEIRTEFVEQGMGPFGKQKVFLTRVKEKYNPYNEDPVKRLDWLPEDIKVAEKADLGIYVGCTQSYRQQKYLILTLRLLQKLGIKFTLLGNDEWCCGSPLLRTGQTEIIRDLVKHNVDAFKEKGVKRVVYACAGCYRTSLIDWPKYYEVPFEVIHITQYLAELVNRGYFKLDANKLAPLEKVVTYHDPCHLGRHIGSIYDAPRTVLKAIPKLKLVEMKRSKETARCCGAGGGVKAGMPDLALKMSIKRLEDATSTGAHTLVTSCPFCLTNFKDALKETKMDLEVLDLVELFANQLGIRAD
ncbi:MAG: (Fe-S)-binding protein [archaeon]|nr:(Fe-S)-binding protein [archaeon]MCP8306801.1 (Fe-S)-binding protein [archaeon]